MKRVIRASGLLMVIALWLALAACQMTSEPSPTSEGFPTPTMPVTRVDQTDLDSTETPSASASGIATPTMTPQPQPTSPGRIDSYWIMQKGSFIYSLDDAVCLQSPGRDPTFLIADEDVASAILSPDGSIAVVNTLGFDSTGIMAYEKIWAINVDGTNPRLLFSTAQLNVEYPEIPRFYIYGETWLPGTHQLLFTTGYASEPGTILNQDIHILDVDTGDYSLAVPPSVNDPRDISPPDLYASPDGQYVAFVIGDSMGVVDVENARWRFDLMTHEHVNTESEFRVQVEPVWSPTTSSFLIAVPPPNRFDGNNTLTVWTLPGNGSAPAKVAEFSVEAEAGPEATTLVLEAVVSPDSRRIAIVTRAYTPRYANRLYIASLDGAEMTLYAEFRSIEFEEWEDNTHFVFAKYAYDDLAVYRGEVGGNYEIIASSDKFPIEAQSCSISD